MSSELFTRVGKPVEPGMVDISYDDAEEFRRLSAFGMKQHYLAIEDNYVLSATSTYTSGVFGLYGLEGDERIHSMAFFTKAEEDLESDYWKGSIQFVRFNGELPQRKFYNSYDVELDDGEVVSAIRRVRIIRHLSDIAFDETGHIGLMDDMHQRKMFEQPMKSSDVVAIGALVSRINTRHKNTGGR